MNKFFNSEETLLDNFNYSNRSEKMKRNLENHMFLPFMVHQKKSESCVKTKFGAHPRNCSESDTSVSASPRQNLSNINFELENLERNKERIKNARRKLHEKLTNTYPSEDQLFEVHIGDSYDVTPVNSFSNLFDHRNNVELDKNNARGSSETRGSFACKRKTSAPTVKCKVEDKAVSKFAATHAQAKIITESVFEKKFKTFVEKSLQILTEIRNLLDKGIEPPDGDEDVSRRKLRVKEFSNRFSRNYLYPIIRQIDDLSRSKQHNSNNQKMLSAYHVIYNGLVAYQNHLPTSIGSCSFDKLKLLLKHLMDLCDIHYKLIPTGDENGYNDFIQSYKHNAEVTLQKVEDQFMNYSEVVTSLQLSAPHFRKENKAPKPVKKPKNSLEDRLYMYSTTAVPKKDSLWKRAAEALGKKKLAVKSRYKTAQFKHRPPMQHIKTEINVPTGPSNCKLLPKKSTSEFKRTSIPYPIDEDNISTLVQMDQGNDKDGQKKSGTKTEPVNDEEIVVKLLQLVLEMKERKKDSCDDNVQRSNEAKISDILEKIKNGCEYEVLKKTLDELQADRKWENGNLELKIVESAESFPLKSSRNKKEPKVTVTGVKNAKLICIQDDNSIETDREDSKDDQTEKGIKLRPLNSENQNDSDKENKENDQKPCTSLNMKRSSKSSKFLQMLPKDYAVSIIQYKIDFHKHCKSNPMYRRTTKITPWILMDQLSDKILNLALLGVAKEVEISEVVEKMYQSELQFC